LIAATSLFWTSRIITAMSVCITFNIIMLVVIVRRKPYLNDLELLYGEDCGERGKYCGLGTNNALELLMVVSELLLWVAALGNDAMGADGTVNEKDALAVMASEYPVGNVFCAALEWVGIVMFLCGVLYCFREMTVAFVKDYCVKKKKARQNQVAVVPRSGAEVADDTADENDFPIVRSNSTLKAAFKTEEQYRRDSASRRSLQMKRRNEASSRLLRRLSDRDGREMVQNTESPVDSDEEERVHSCNGNGSASQA